MACLEIHYDQSAYIFWPTEGGGLFLKFNMSNVKLLSAAGGGAWPNVPSPKYAPDESFSLGFKSGQRPKFRQRGSIVLVKLFGQLQKEKLQGKGLSFLV